MSRQAPLIFMFIVSSLSASAKDDNNCYPQRDGFPKFCAGDYFYHKVSTLETPGPTQVEQYFEQYVRVNVTRTHEFKNEDCSKRIKHKKEKRPVCTKQLKFVVLPRVHNVNEYSDSRIFRGVERKVSPIPKSVYKDKDNGNTEAVAQATDPAKMTSDFQVGLIPVSKIKRPALLAKTKSKPQTRKVR